MLEVITTQLKVMSGKAQPISDYKISNAIIFKNEPFSFQLVYSGEAVLTNISIEINSPLPTEAWRVDLVPISNSANDYNEAGYVTEGSGAVPDLLEPISLKPEIIQFPPVDPEALPALYFPKNEKNTLNATRGEQSVLVTVNPESIDLKPGKYTLEFALRELKLCTEKERAVLELEVLDAALPKQNFCVTNWMHIDCLCDFYGCEPYSERFYQIFKTFIHNMTRHRQNTLLIPAFTPELDVPIGDVRRNVQLVDIEKRDGKWYFNFDRLAYFLRVAVECGIEYFEHCHLFTQWGAKNAPTIYNTEGQQLFGWDTDASSEEYAQFLKEYLTAYISFARSEGYTDDMLIFHISDEPTDKMLDHYKKAYAIVCDILAPFKCIDALSHIEFYRMGLVKNPVAIIKNAEIFAKECDNDFWVYYTCGTYTKQCTNRLISNTPARTRVLGAQMYKYGASGFLHWGYNYYYDRLSYGFFDPKVNPCGYKQLPGASYLAYPEREGAVPSLREVYMREAFDDIRALQLYESLTSRNEALALLEDSLGRIDVHTIPEKNAMYRLNQEIKTAIKKRLVG